MSRRTGRSVGRMQTHQDGPVSPGPGRPEAPPPSIHERVPSGSVHGSAASGWVTMLALSLVTAQLFVLLPVSSLVSSLLPLSS